MVRFVFLFVVLVAAAARADDAYVTGEDYLAMPAEQRTAYIMAAADMQARFLREFDAGSDSAAFIERVQRCTKDMTSAKLREFIDDYMAKDAAYRTYTMVSNFRAALHEKCPA